MADPLDAFIVKSYDSAPSTTSTVGPAQQSGDPLAAHIAKSYDEAPPAAAAVAATAQPAPVAAQAPRPVQPDEPGYSPGATTTLSPQELTNMFYRTSADPKNITNGEIDVSSATQPMAPSPSSQNTLPVAPPAATSSAPPAATPVAPPAAQSAVPSAPSGQPQPAPTAMRPAVAQLPVAQPAAMPQAPAATGVSPPPMAPGQAGNASQQTAQPAPAPPMNASQQGQPTAGNVARALGDGLLMGFGDELTAGVRSLMGENYASALQDERQKLAAYQQAHPGQAMSAEVLGGLAPLAMSFVAPELAPAAVARLVPSTARAALAPIASNMLGRAAMTGAGAGAVSGFGHGEGGFDNRITGAAYGAPVGAAFGVGGNMVGSAIGKLVTPNSAGMGLWARQLHQADTNPNTVLAAAQQARATADAAADRPPGAAPDPLAPPQLTAGETLGDPATMGLMDTTANLPGHGMKMARQIADNRTSRGQLTDALTGAFGPRQSAVENEMRLYAERSNQANNDYTTALQGVDTAPHKDVIAKMLKNVPSDYFHDARDRAEAFGGAFNVHIGKDADGNIVKTKVPSAQYLHNIYSDLTKGSQVRQAHFAGAPRTADAAAAYVVKKPIKAFLDNVTGGRYEIAARNYAKHSRLIEANDAGMAALKPSTRHEDIANDLAQKFTTRAEHGAYATGVLQAIRDQMRTMGSVGNEAERVFGKDFKKENLRAAMRSVHPDQSVTDKLHERLSNFLEAQNQAYRNAQGWVGNSKTAIRTQSAKAMMDHIHGGLLHKIGSIGHGGHGTNGAAGAFVAFEAAEHLGLHGPAIVAAIPALMAGRAAFNYAAKKTGHSAAHRATSLLFQQNPEKIADTLESLHARMIGKPHGAAGVLQQAGGTAGGLIGALAAGRTARK
jgi:hypothetical protein